MKLKIILAFFCLMTIFAHNGFAGKNEGSPVDLYFLWLEQKQAAIPEMKKALTDENWRIRTHALLSMGKTGDKALIPLVMDQLAKDDNVSVKNCAVIALGDLKASQAVPDLIALLNPEQASGTGRVNPMYVVDALRKIGDSRALKPLFGRLLTGSRTLQPQVTQALIAIGDPTISRMLLENRDRVEARRVERYAAEVFGELPVPGVEPFLMEKLRGADMPCKNAAVIALGKMRYEPAVPDLIADLQKGDTLLAKNAATALAQIDSPKAVEPLYRLIASPSLDIQMQSADILSQMSAGDIAPKIFQLFEAAPKLNAPTVYVLARKQYYKALPLIRKRLKTPDLPGQDELAKALGWLKDDGAIPLLMTVAQRQNRAGAKGAIWALGHLEAVDAVPVLLNLMKNGDANLLPVIIGALGSIGDQRAAGPIIDLFYNSYFRFGALIAKSLVKIGGPAVVDFVKDNIEAGQDKRRKVADYVLTHLKDKSAVPYVLSLLDHPDDSIRKKAILSLQSITGLDYQTPAKWRSWAASHAR